MDSMYYVRHRRNNGKQANDFFSMEIKDYFEKTNSKNIIMKGRQE